MALILLDAAGVVSGHGAGEDAAPPVLGQLAVGDALADRLQRLASAGDADAAALHRALVDLLAGQLTWSEHDHGAWRITLQACAPGSVAAVVLVAARAPAPAELRRHHERLEELLVSRTVQLAEASEKAEAAGRARSDLLAHASHEIRTPLNAIVSLSHLLGLGLADVEQRRRVQTIEQSARRLSQLFDEVLAQALGDAAAAPAPPAASPVDAGEQLRQRHAGRRVLLAEDDEINQLALRELLSMVGLEVDTAGDGLEAVERATGGGYALILLDLRMPRLDGIAAARALRTLPGLQATPIVAITANAFEEDRRACRAAGMNDFLSKPVEVSPLYQVLLRWLDAHPDGARGSARTPPVAEWPAPPDAATSLLPLFGLEGIDAAGGLAAVGGKAAVYRRLLQVFVDTHAGDGARLRQHVQCGDPAAAGALVHRLRGSAATLGLVDVETAAAALESAIDDGTDPAVLPLLAEAVAGVLADTLGRLHAALAR